MPVKEKINAARRVMRPRRDAALFEQQKGR
jgi:hypothetical protein